MSTTTNSPFDLPVSSLSAVNVERNDRMVHRAVTTRAYAIGFPANALNTPMFEGKDFAGLIAAIAITLGPLAAYSFGWGA
jgi:hypothetical protein